MESHSESRGPESDRQVPDSGSALEVARGGTKKEALTSRRRASTGRLLVLIHTTTGLGTVAVDAIPSSQCADYVTRLPLSH